MTRRLWAVVMPLMLSGAGAAAAVEPPRDEARPRELQRLLEEARNLDQELQALGDADPDGAEIRGRAEEIREDTIYLKVKMRRHHRAGGSGTGIDYAEVAELRQSISDLRRDLARLERSGGDGRDARLPEGTRILVRLDEPLSSRSARREDRFDASVHQPVLVGGRVAVPAGSRVRGIVALAEPAQRPSKGGRLELQFDALYLERSRMDLDARVVSIDQDDTGRDGASRAGIGAVLGGVLGGILGGRKGAIVGILVGGTGAVVASKGDEVELPAGTIVTLALQRPLDVRRD